MSKFTLCALILSLSLFNNWAIQIPLSRPIWSIDIGDVDHNGLKDIVVGHYVWSGTTVPSFTVLYNYSDGSFADVDSSFILGEAQEHIQFANMNSDSFPDIVSRCCTIDESSQYVRVYYNQSGLFSSSSYTDYPFTGVNGYIKLRTCDVNGDTLGDVIFYGNYGYVWAMVSNGPYQYLPLYQGNLFSPQDVTCGDVDNDGRDEVIFADQPLLIYDYTDDGWQLISEPNMNFHSEVKLGDVDNDGINEIFTLEIPPVGNEFPFRIYKLINGQICLMYQHIYTSTGGLKVFDYNNDGLADYKLGRRLETNLGNYTFSESWLTYPDFESSGSQIEDMNNDGWLDMVFMSGDNSSSYLVILFGDGQGHFVEEPGVGTEDITAHDQIGLQLKCYPNPFVTSTHISISGEVKTSEGDLRIFNVRGQLVRKLNFNSDAYSVEWDGRDQHNRPVSNGIYFCRYVDHLKASSTIRCIKIK